MPQLTRPSIAPKASRSWPGRSTPALLVWLAEEARLPGCALIHYSTDYVFDGSKGQRLTWRADIPNPLGVYGQSKLEGEQAIQAQGGAYLILRTSWVYSLRRDSFVTKVLALVPPAAVHCAW